MRNNPFVRRLLIMAFCLAGYHLSAQELYVFSEPASNMPAKSFSAKYSGKFLKEGHNKQFGQRHMLEGMFGFNKRLMVHISGTASNMYSKPIQPESVKLYGKYRFLSNDEVHQHFRMAAFGEVAYSRNYLMYDELNLNGDQSGVQGGIIATQLWRKIAVSGTLAYLQVLNEKPKAFPEQYPYQAINYSISAGYLLFPRNYQNYKQTNLNIYVEAMGQQTLDKRRFYFDIAPALQLIFNSNSKLNFGYRIQANGNMHRMAVNSWHVSFERTFLNALRRKSS